ncbi:hypothetical protein ACIQZB_45110 [Streptomyces sp. NPDC097727]|uniref:hypothetical protein n=1 Tax=Streptomyces sp. NPDC097727 TaxID=3366092 RepID=UPI0037F61306
MKGLHMYGHDRLLIILLLILTGLGIGYIQHRWPAIAEATDIATKVLITLIGLLIYASSGTTEQNTPTNPAPAPSTSAAPTDQNLGNGSGPHSTADFPSRPCRRRAPRCTAAAQTGCS